MREGEERVHTARARRQEWAEKENAGNEKHEKAVQVDQRQQPGGRSRKDRCNSFAVSKQIGKASCGLRVFIRPGGLFGKHFPKRADHYDR